MKIRARINLVAATLLTSTLHMNAVEGFTIVRESTNVVLSWASTGNESYLIRYRAAFSPETPWVNLTNLYPAAQNTNRTTFVISGVVAPPPPPGGGGGGEPPPPPLPGESSAMSAYVSDGTEYPLDEATVQYLAARRVYPPYIWDLEHRTPYAWELAVRPRMPWECEAFWQRYNMHSSIPENMQRLYEEFQMLKAGGLIPAEEVTTFNAIKSATMAEALTESGEGGSSMGFYSVYHIPDFAADVTAQPFDGATFIPVDFADYMDRVLDTSVLLNGEPTPHAVFTSYLNQGQTNWGMGIYFNLIPNGAYQIQLQSTVPLNDNVGDESVYLVLSGRPASIVVDNQVTFTNWDDFIFGASYTFKAQTKNPATDWAIDIYDAWGQYVNGGSGHTTDGQITWTWDLRDIWGNLRDDLDYDPYFDPYITFDTWSAGFAGAGAQTTRPTPSPQVQYPKVGGWIISYADRFYLDAGPNYADGDTDYQAGISTLVGGPGLWDIPAVPFPLKFGTNAYTQTERNNSWADLRAWLYDGRYRNFYYYGHGSADLIGADVHTFGTNGAVTGGALFLPNSSAFLRSARVRTELTFNRFGGSRPYRFAFLDGCNTANGSWPEAFGVNKATNSLSYYTGADNIRRVRPSAFVGWNVTVGGAGWGTVDKYWEFRSFWMGNWAVNINNDNGRLSKALEDARTGSEWIPEQRLRDHLRVYGYHILKFDEYNRKGDWPP